MSGICGVIRFDGMPVGGTRVERLTRAMGYRGPDGLSFATDGNVGMGHAHLDTGRDTASRNVHRSHDGAWIVADARIDAREELCAALSARALPVAASAGDAELILAAYRAWGADCASYLLGDFAFAIWDPTRRELFCARDPFGVKPFFFAQSGAEFLFANTLLALATAADLSRELDPAAIGDLLLFGWMDARRTAFAAIRRLPPGHVLAANAQGVREREYWTIPEGVEPEARADAECLEEFAEILRSAVRDRMERSNVAIMMSGGLDSTAVAALAAAERARRGMPVSITAHTEVYDRVIPDEERRYAGIAAAHLGLPIVYRAGDDYGLFGGYERYPRFYAEPSELPFAALEVDFSVDAASSARVLLTGWNGDALLAESSMHHFKTLLRSGRFLDASALALRFGLAERRWPASLRPGARLNDANPGPAAAWPYPSWLDTSFERRNGLRERWHDVMGALYRPHPTRPSAMRSLRIARSTNFFERYDPGRTGALVEHRHPFVDLRLVEFCLRLPTFPWCHRKAILRDTMKPHLPQEIVHRPKTGLCGFPFVQALARDDAKWIGEHRLSAEAQHYIDASRWAGVDAGAEPWRVWADLRPVGFDLWLRHFR
jgi:asparagine synthase (glutamine-hydrolysing)